MSEAMESLAKAAQGTPDEPRFSYVHAVALHDTGKRAEAIEVLKGALARRPYDRDILWALASYKIEVRDYLSARGRAELLLRLEPSRADVSQVLEALRRRAR
jgi:tetratricopeptide (TPR) repeat protein